MARASMAALITRTRELINDPAGASAHFTDDKIEAALDRRRREVVELPLDGVARRDATGQVDYVRWVADRAPWESGAVVLDATRTPIPDTEYTEDALDGIWTFDTAQDAAYVTGLSFDLYGTAADLLDQWIAEGVATGGGITEWETDGQRVKRGTSTADMLSKARLYRLQALPTFSSFSRTDFASDGGGW